MRKSVRNLALRPLMRRHSCARIPNCPIPTKFTLTRRSIPFARRLDVENVGDRRAHLEQLCVAQAPERPTRQPAIVDRAELVNQQVRVLSQPPKRRDADPQRFGAWIAGCSAVAPADRSAASHPWQRRTCGESHPQRREKFGMASRRARAMARH